MNCIPLIWLSFFIVQSHFMYLTVSKIEADWCCNFRLLIQFSYWKKVLEYIKLSYYFFTRCLTSHETQTILTFPYQFHSKTQSRTNLCTDFVHGTSISNTPGRIGIWDNMPCVNLKFVCFVAKCVFLLLSYIDCRFYLIDLHFWNSNNIFVLHIWY